MYSRHKTDQSTNAMQDLLALLPGHVVSRRFISRILPLLAISLALVALVFYQQAWRRHDAQQTSKTAAIQRLVDRFNSDYSSDEFRICPQCSCEKPLDLGFPAAFNTLPSLESLRSAMALAQSAHIPGVNQFLSRNVVLKAAVEGVTMTKDSLQPILRTYYECPDDQIALDFRNLKLNRPTLYAYTRTSRANGKIGSAWSQRAKYFQRHRQNLLAHLQHVRAHGYADGAKSAERQFLWIVVEDAFRLDVDVLEFLQGSTLPFLYIAFGKTADYGCSQWNVAIRTIDVLRSTFFGDGPVINVDDDSRMEPSLFDKIWRVRRAIFWQVGNIDGWEGPVFVDGQLVEWQYQWKRTLPIDMNGFAIFSAEIGAGRAIPGPQYIPDGCNGSGTAESDYLVRIYSSRKMVEPLCNNTVAEKCYLAWHNSWLSDDGSEPIDDVATGDVEEYADPDRIQTVPF